MTMTDERAVEVLAAMRDDGGCVDDADWTAAIDRAIAALSTQAAGGGESVECQMMWSPKGMHEKTWTCRYCKTSVVRNGADGHPFVRCTAPPSAPVGATLSNPWTGKPRDYRDVDSDPEGVLCVEPGAPLKAATSVEGLTTKEAWWAGYRAGKGLPADTPRQEALAQQPAAVDEAMARRLDDYLGGEFDIRIGKQAAHAALTAALATQHQEPTT